MNAMKILFAGTPDFARVSLQALVDSGNKPYKVLTQPDRRAGRGKRITASSVKQYAESVHIEVMQPETLKDSEVVTELSALQPDVIVVAAYGLLFPQAVLDIPAAGCLNVHASLLPRGRGAAPIQQAILQGDQQTGICLMGMEVGLDTGPVYAKRAIDIGINETAGELHDRLAALGGDLLVEKLQPIVEGNLYAEIQDDALATYAEKMKKTDACIDWSSDAEMILRQIRAYNPAPGAFFQSQDEVIKCWQAELLPDTNGDAGNVLGVDKFGVDVACGIGAIRLLQLQRPGRNRITGAEFAAQSILTDAWFG
jgi:methionyl-tRNA formyltransferase